MFNSCSRLTVLFVFFFHPSQLVWYPCDFLWLHFVQPMVVLACSGLYNRVWVGNLAVFGSILVPQPGDFMVEKPLPRQAVSNAEMWGTPLETSPLVTAWQQAILSWTPAHCPQPISRLEWPTPTSLLPNDPAKEAGEVQPWPQLPTIVLHEIVTARQ